MKVSQTGCFGKLPQHGDFVRQRDQALVACGLEGWLQEGAAHLNRPGGTTGPFEPVRFVCAGDTDSRCTVGVAVPSRDRVGRKFPLLLFAELGELQGAGALAEMPLLGEDFLRAAEGVAELGGRGMEVDTLRRHVDSLRGFGNDEGTRQRVDAYQRSTTLHEFCGAVLDVSEPEVILRWLANLDAALATGTTPRFVVETVGMSEPLWLTSLLAVLHRVGGMAPRMLVWDGGRDAPTISVRVLYDGLHARYFLPLMFRGVDSDYGWDVTPRADGSDQISDAARAKYADPAMREDLLLAEFLGNT